MALLPWVRLHGARAYLDVGELLDEYPHVHLTVNFVPSLVSQLEAAAKGAPDAWLELARRPIDSLSLDERATLLERHFSVHWGRAVETRPRYRELLEKRGRQLLRADLPDRAKSFSNGELRDLTVLFYLSWIGFAARRGDAELEALEKQGRDFALPDLELVAEKQRLACARVLPLYRQLEERGQIELSTSPLYHPILPLLISTATARRAQPSLPLPEPFSFRQDAVEQVRRASDAHQRTFGRRPRGMWPPEGSISPEALAVYGAEKVGWIATDEGNLWRSLELSKKSATRGDLFRAYRHQDVDLVFRDRELSDRIGFAYSHGDHESGVRDLLGRARDNAKMSTAPADEAPFIGVFLDGENPWESYAGSGEPFLRTLFEALRDHPELKSASIREHLDASASRVELPQAHSGSWIDSDFHIWIGDPVKNRAWSLLGHARQRLERARGKGVAPDRLARAYDHLLAAEGSDWFWWFGEPFHSAEDALFDRLFRAHLEGAYAELGEPIPQELGPAVSTALEGRQKPAATTGLSQPYAFIRPRIDHERSGFYEWHGAGRYLVPRGAAMADTPLVEVIHFGFDPETLFLRLDLSSDRAAEANDATLDLEITTPRIPLRLLADKNHWTLCTTADDATPREIATGTSVSFERSLKLSIPFSALDAQPGEPLHLSFRLIKDDVVIARYPVDVPLTVSVPDESFEARNWSA